VDDRGAGYPHGSPYLNEFLYGSQSKSVKLSPKHPEAKLNIALPPKPALLTIRVTSRETKAEIAMFTIKMMVPGEKNRQVSFDFKSGGVAQDHELLVPPDQGVIVEVVAPGFRKWPNDSHDRMLYLPSGTRTVFDPELEPVK
jgi:hypothetical protein